MTRCQEVSKLLTECDIGMAITFCKEGEVFIFNKTIDKISCSVPIAFALEVLVFCWYVEA